MKPYISFASFQNEKHLLSIPDPITAAIRLACARKTHVSIVLKDGTSFTGTIIQMPARDDDPAWILKDEDAYSVHGYKAADIASVSPIHPKTGGTI